MLIPTTSLQTIFAFTDALAHKRKADAVLMLHDPLSQGSDPYYLFSMMVYQFRNLIRIKSIGYGTPATLAKATGIHPYAAQKAQQQAQQFSAEELKSLYQSLHGIEQDAKQGVVDIEDSLYRFVFSLPSR